MSYKKHMQVVPTNQRLKNQLARTRDYDPTTGGSSANYASILPEVYEGSPMRIDRYGQYDDMDNDSDINSALDTIADFSVQKDEKTDEVFEIKYRKEASDTEVEILKNCLMQWCKINDFKRRAWRMFRSTLKYGDQFFIRDPETLRWFWVDPSKVDKILVNEAEGKQPEAYIFSDLDVNLNSFTATAPDEYGQNLTGGTSQMNLQRPARDTKRWGKGSTSNNSRFDNQASQTAIEATHVIHLSLSEGLDINWPFGTSILEGVFKVWREKGLLEEAVIIYRIQRAPERRVFYVDVGGMPLHKVGGYLEKVKNEIHQRRYPNRTGGGASIGDATYNPMSMMEDFFFAQSAEGRGSRVETLPAGENLGQIDDLKFWTNKLLRGLRVPSSYLPTGPDDGVQSLNDGRVGTAYIQEFRFAQYCRRLQDLLSPVFDDEFKLFVKRRGFNIDSSLYDLNFSPPENFGVYAKLERDAAAINVYQPLAEMKHFSKRWLMINKLGMTEEEINENERMWREENREATKGTLADDDLGGGAPVGLNSVGIRPTDELDMGDDMAGEESADTEADAGDDGSASPISGDEASDTGDEEL